MPRSPDLAIFVPTTTELQTPHARSVCHTYGPYRSTLKPVFYDFDRLVVLTSRLDA